MYDDPAVVRGIRAEDGEHGGLLSRLCQDAVDAELLLGELIHIPRLSLIVGIAGKEKVKVKDWFILEICSL